MKSAKRIFIRALLLFAICGTLIPLSAFAHGLNGIAGNGTWGVYIDIYGPAYRHYAEKAYGYNAYGRSGCAWFACSRAYELTGIDTVLTSGQSWYSYRYAQYGYTRGKTIREKAIVCYTDHSAFVEEIRGNEVLISEGGWPAYQNDCCILQVKTIGEVEGRHGFLGYVYLPVAKPPAPEPVVIREQSLSTALVGQAYHHAFTVKSGASPISWSLTGGMLPDGLTLHSSGVLDGIPQKSGSFAFTVCAANGDSRASMTYILTVTAQTSSPLAFSAKLSNALSSFSFSDVSPDNKFFSDICYVYLNGLMGGVGKDYFGVSQPMTREMLWAVLARMDGANMSGGAYDAGRRWAVGAGISDGKNGAGSLTREQLVTMLYRACGEPETSGDISMYSDTGKIGGFAVKALSWAREKNLIGGYDDGTIRPKAVATRAQVAAILHRYVENIAPPEAEAETETEQV